LEGGCLAGGENAILTKSKAFAVRIVRLYQHLADKKKEFVISKQLLRSGTSIGANVREAVQAQSHKDFAAKMGIALKEASESEYWLELLAETDYLTENEYASMAKSCGELNKLLTAIVKTAKGKRR
jgi:four helix bundle protein